MPKQPQGHRSDRRVHRPVLLLVLGLFAVSRLSPGTAQDDAGEPGQPVGRYLTLDSPITDETIGWVRQTGLQLQQIAVEERRPTSLILEVRPGTSQFHHVYALANFLTSTDIANVNTIAWVPDTVVGHNVIPALSCSEIVMHPDAQIGDIGLGNPLPADQQQFVREMVAKRRNTKVNESLASALMDPGATLVQLTLQPAPGEIEKRLVTEQEAQRILDAGVEIKNRRTIKEAGTPGLFSGASARGQELLVHRTVDNRTELADAYSLPPEALREQRPHGAAASVSLIEVSGMIEPVLETFLVRQIDRAVAAGSTTIIFEINSGGGMLYPSRDLAFRIAELEDQRVRTIAYVPAEAYSGAALIALGCDEIYMHPEAQIGDILPLEVKPGQPLEQAPKKVLGPLVGWLRDLADKKKRPSSVCMAMANLEIEVFQATNAKTGSLWYMTKDELHKKGDDWVAGPMIRESAEKLPLTVGGPRAHELRIAEQPVADFEELKKRVGIPPDVNPARIGRTWIDTLVFTLNTRFVMGLLFFVGIICIYLELHFTSGLLGIIAALCFGLFFWSKFLGGTAGWLEVLLCVIGLGCLGIEFFVAPGVTVFGVSGGLLLLASLIMASQTFGNLEPGRDIKVATETMTTLCIAVGAVIGTAMLISRYLPAIPLLNRMVLAPPGGTLHDPDEPRLRPELTSSASHHQLVGQMGTAATVLRPSGKARIEGRLVDVVSDGPFVETGAQVEVVRVAGNKIVVRQA